MKLSRVFLFAFVLLGFAATRTVVCAAGSAQAGEGKGQLVATADTDAAWLAKARAEYPTEVCTVSGDKFGGDMGDPVERIYRVVGQPDRLIRFCCKGCLKDFNKDPDKYLKILDDAAAATAKKNPPAQAR